jgi:hypothetical protein
LYLWHWPILAYTRLLLPNPSPIETLLAVTLSIVLAVMTYRLVEQRARDRSKAVKPMVAAMAGLAAAVAVGAATPDQRPWLGDTRALADLKPQFPAGGPCEIEGLSKQTQWRCVAAAQDVRSAVLGDSHGARMFVGLNKVQPGKWMVVGRAGCSPSIGARSFKPDIACDQAAMVIDALAESRVDEVLMIFRQGYDLGSGLDESVRRLKAAGKHVVIVISVPDVPLPHHVRFCIPRPMIRGELCDFDRADAERRQAAMRAIVAAVAAKHGAAVVDPMDTLCDDKLCHVYRDGVLMYQDDNHLSVRGSQLVARGFLRQLGSP